MNQLEFVQHFISIQEETRLEEGYLHLCIYEDTHTLSTLREHYHIIMTTNLLITEPFKILLASYTLYTLSFMAVCG